MDAVRCLLLAIQCKAKAGARKKKTRTIRMLRKNINAIFPNSFSSILNIDVAHDDQVLQKAYVAKK